MSPDDHSKFAPDERDLTITRVPNPYPWLGWDPDHGPYCKRCGHGIAVAEDPYEHDPNCPVTTARSGT